jgi:hypothetical protein
VADFGQPYASHSFGESVTKIRGKELCVFVGTIDLFFDIAKTTDGEVIVVWRLKIEYDAGCIETTYEKCAEVESGTQGGSYWNGGITLDTSTDGKLSLEMIKCCDPCPGPPLSVDFEDAEWNYPPEGELGLQASTPKKAPDFMQNIYNELTSGTNPGSISDSAYVVIRRQLLAYITDKLKGKSEEWLRNCENLNAVCRGADHLDPSK